MKIIDLYDTIKVFNTIRSVLGMLQLQTSSLYLYLDTNNKYVDLDDEYMLGYSSNKNLSLLYDNLKATYTDTISLKSKLGKIIINRYFDKWNKIIATLQLEYNAIENYSMVEEESSSNEGSTSSTGSTTNLTKTKTNITTSNDTEHKRSGYNSNNYQPDSKDEQDTHVTGSPDENYNDSSGSVNDSTSSSNEGSRTLTRSGNIGVTTSQQMIESELKLREYNINKMMYDDIDKILTSNIYV